MERQISALRSKKARLLYPHLQRSQVGAMSGICFWDAIFVPFLNHWLLLETLSWKFSLYILKCVSENSDTDVIFNPLNFDTPNSIVFTACMYGDVLPVLVENGSQRREKIRNDDKEFVTRIVMRTNS